MDKIYGLIGRKLGHSFSVPIHKSFGCPDYSLIELEPEELKGFMENKNFSAINVTIPYKHDVMEFCGHISLEAQDIGAVNTIVNKNGELYAYNTDIYGFQYMMKSAGIGFEGKKVLILGSGGTSHTTRVAARYMKAHEIVIISRSGEDNYENISKHADTDIIVNTTPVGMYPNCPASPIDLDIFKNLSGVVDVVFNPCRTGIILQAEKLGIPHVSGLKMLVAQAKQAEELFFGISIDDNRIEEITAEIKRQTQNIVLIGMPGGGKSTVGNALSSICGRECVDIDDMISERAGMTIPDIFSKYGEEYFRQLETESLYDAGKRSGIIITAGGGIVTQPRNYPLVHQNGRIYEICRPINLLATDGRPLSTDMEALAAMYEKRRPMYESFRDIKIDNNSTIKACAEKIWSDFCENSGN